MFKNFSFIGLFTLSILLIGCAEVNSFDACVEKGGEVMESYPRQCRDGEDVYVEEVYEDKREGQFDEDLGRFTVETEESDTLEDESNNGDIDEKDSEEYKEQIAFCEENGGEHLWRIEDDYERAGYCVFENGSEVNARYYLNGSDLAYTERFKSDLHGIEFNYSKWGDYRRVDEIKIEENEEVIKIDYNYIEVFKKDAEESMEDAIKRIFLDEEQREICFVEEIQRPYVSSAKLYTIFLDEEIHQREWKKNDSLAINMDFCGSHSARSIRTFFYYQESQPEKFIFVNTLQDRPLLDLNSIEIL